MWLLCLRLALTLLKQVDLRATVTVKGSCQGLRIVSGDLPTVRVDVRVITLGNVQSWLSSLRQVPVYPIVLGDGSCLAGIQFYPLLCSQMWGTTAHASPRIAVTCHLLLTHSCRWLGWDKASSDGERTIVGFSGADAAALQDACDGCSVLLTRRRHEILLAISGVGAPLAHR